ncbi:MAG: zinc ABC transporter substrate-binding protein [Azoarcus sp.]|jgi:zinc/manganese transport system substrate-binding protein|nr:zinc ABC transporter substrate-binding protein [Azoarcus sp.]
MHFPFRFSLRRTWQAVFFLVSAFFIASGARATEVEVITSFSILGDLIHQIGGERVSVHTLVGPGQDAHAYEPRPSDARRIKRARLVVQNGLGFDDWLPRLARASGYQGKLVVASDGIRPLAMHNDAPRIDPHAWQDVANVQIYVANIVAALIAADPGGAEFYRANATRYRAALDVLDADIRAAVARLPQERRRVVSAHDAFGYFARAYGLIFLAPKGASAHSKPGARDVARLIKQLRSEKAPAVFIETILDPRLIERIRIESGATMGGTLYSDALSPPGGPASTYIAMMRHNLDTLMAALAVY